MSLPVPVWTSGKVGPLGGTPGPLLSLHRGGGRDYSNESSGSPVLGLTLTPTRFLHTGLVPDLDR